MISPKDRVIVTENAARVLRTVARQLRAVGATSAAAYVARAVKSVDGAHRHAIRLECEQAQGDK